MPEGGDKLPAADLKRLADWIDLGAAYDLPLAGTDPISESPAASNHWSFRPLSQPHLPEVRSPKTTIRNEIDRFILATT